MEMGRDLDSISNVALHDTSVGALVTGNKESVMKVVLPGSGGKQRELAYDADW